MASQAQFAALNGIAAVLPRASTAPAPRASGATVHPENSPPFVFADSAPLPLRI